MKNFALPIFVFLLLAGFPARAQGLFSGEHTNAVALSPMFSVSPASLDFGTMTTGISKTDSVIVTNAGADTLTISYAITDASEFTVTPKNAVIPAAGALTFYITYAPYVPGFTTGYVSFIHNAASRLDTVAVRGTAAGATLVPVFSVTPSKLAFGDVANGSTKRDSVVVRNTGQAPLILTSVTSIDAAFTMTLKLGIIAPNDSLTVYVTFAPTVVGAYYTSISFFHNAGSGKNQIQATGNGTGPGNISVFSPNQTRIDFGNVTNGQTKRDSVVIANTGQTALKITSVTSSNSVFILSPSSGTVAPNASLKFFVTFAPTFERTYPAYIRFRDNTPAGKDSIEVMGNGIEPDFVPEFAISSTRIDFGDVVNGHTKMDSITITNTGVAPLDIYNISSGNAAVTVTWNGYSLDANASMKVFVTFAPLTAGSYSTFIRFSSNTPNRSDSIQVTGNGTGSSLAPVFSVAPASLDFGSIRAGTRKTDSVTVTNVGTAPLIVSFASATSSRYTVPWMDDPDTLAPGVNKIYRITFAPSSAGTWQGLILYFHNGVQPQDSVIVTGSAFGVPPAAKYRAVPSSLDFGVTANGIPKTDSITVYNDGDATLTFNSITSTNTAFIVSPKYGSITPSSKLTYKITFLSLSDGSQSGGIVFAESSGKQDTVALFGTGTGGSVAPAFTCAPKSLNFDTCTTGMLRMESVEVKNTGMAPLTITSITSSNALFSVDPAAFSLLPGTSRFVQITFAPTAPGVETASITFRHNAVPGSDNIPAIGQGVGATLHALFSIDRRTLAFGPVAMGASVKDSVLVTNSDGVPLIITRAASAQPFYESPMNATIAPSESKWFVVMFRPSGYASFTQPYVFEHNGPSLRDTVMLSGSGDLGVEGPFFQGTPKILLMGSVATNTTKVDSVIVHKGGRQDLVITQALSGNSSLTVTPQSATIAPTASQAFQVSFNPTDTLSYNTTLLFSDNTQEMNDTIFMAGLGMMVLPIQKVRLLANGSEAIFEGIVTRTKGAFTRVQDATGAITIIEAGGAFFKAVASGDVAMGDLVRVHGKVSELNALKIVNNDDLVSFEVLSRGNALPQPIQLPLAFIAADGEKYESRLVTVPHIWIESSDTVLRATKSYQISYFSDTSHAVTLRIGNATDTDADGMPLIHYVDFTGVLTQSSVTSPTIGYQLLPVLPTDLVERSTPVDGLESAPDNYSLDANYPNPFNPSTTIAYSIPKDGRVTLRVFDLYGREVATLASGIQHTGRYQVAFDAKDLPSGTYCYRLEADRVQIVNMMTLMK